MPETLQEFLERALNASPGEKIRGTFDHPRTGVPDYDKMTGEFSGGDFSMTGAQIASADALGQKVLDLLEQHGVDPRDITDLERVMGYDHDNMSLSAEEVGAYLVGMAMAENTTHMGMRGLIHQLDPSFIIKSDDLAVEIGQQVFGDNHPGESGIDTESPESVDGIYNAYDGPVARC